MTMGTIFTRNYGYCSQECDCRPLCGSQVNIALKTVTVDLYVVLRFAIVNCTDVKM